MKKDIVDILCCPTCKGSLDLEIKEEKNNDVIKGTFTCKNCNCVYTIQGGIPNLLPK